MREGCRGGGAGGAEGVVVVEGVAVDQEDRVDLGLGDLVEDVASAAAEADDHDALPAEAAVDGGDAGAGGGGVAVGEGRIVLDFLVRRAGGGSGRGIDSVGVVGDDPGVRGDLRVLVGVAVRGLAGEHEVRLDAVGDRPGLRGGKRQRSTVLIARGGAAEPDAVVGAGDEPVSGDGDGVGEEAVGDGAALGDVRDADDDMAGDEGDVVAVVEEAGEVGVMSEKCGRHRRPSLSLLGRCGRR